MLQLRVLFCETGDPLPETGDEFALLGDDLLVQPRWGWADESLLTDDRFE